MTRQRLTPETRQGNYLYNQEKINSRNRTRKLSTWSGGMNSRNRTSLPTKTDYGSIPKTGRGDYLHENHLP